MRSPCLCVNPATFVPESCDETNDFLRLNRFSHVLTQTNSGDNRLSDIPRDHWTGQVND